MSLLLTLDAGTTSVKGALFDASGNMMCSRVHEYALEKPAPDIVELDPDVYWQAAQTVIGKILAETAVAPDAITALGVTSQGETLIVLDRNGQPLRKAIIWLDNRAKDEAAAIQTAFGRDRVYQITGQQDIVPGWPASKILWLRRHEPHIFKAAATFLMVEDYLIYRLTGRLATDHALNPSTLYYDLRAGCWWADMLEFLGITARQLPELLDSGASAGTVTAAIGLSRHTRVTVSPIDQVAAAVGAGNIAPGTITETTGSALAICATVDHPLYDPAKRVGLYRHALPGLYVLLPWIPTAGMILRWFRDEFGDGLDYAALAGTAAAIAPGSEGLIVLPHFCGMVCPETNPDAKGVLHGLSLSHRRAHIVRAILESVAFSLRDNLDMLTDLGIDCREIISLGGGARSELWLGIKADVLQQPIRVMRCEETTCLGSAVLAAAGSGVHTGVEAAVKAMVCARQAIAPDPGHRAVYDAAFARYRELNRTLFQL
jgi:xylulokinase